MHFEHQNEIEFKYRTLKISMIEKEDCTTDCYLAANRTEEQSKIFQASFYRM